MWSNEKRLTTFAANSLAKAIELWKLEHTYVEANVWTRRTYICWMLHARAANWETSRNHMCGKRTLRFELFTCHGYLTWQFNGLWTMATAIKPNYFAFKWFSFMKFPLKGITKRFTHIFTCRLQTTIFEMNWRTSERISVWTRHNWIMTFVQKQTKLWNVCRSYVIYGIFLWFERAVFSRHESFAQSFTAASLPLGVSQTFIKISRHL